MLKGGAVYGLVNGSVPVGDSLHLHHRAVPRLAVVARELSQRTFLLPVIRKYFTFNHKFGRGWYIDVGSDAFHHLNRTFSDSARNLCLIPVIAQSGSHIDNRICTDDNRDGKGSPLAFRLVVEILQVAPLIDHDAELILPLHMHPLEGQVLAGSVYLLADNHPACDDGAAVLWGVDGNRYAF